MKKLLFLTVLLIIGSISFADNNVNNQTPTPAENQTDNTAGTEENNEEPKANDKAVSLDDNLPKPDYTTEIKGNQIFYYDKEGKFFARDKKINEQTFFYNKTGQLTGKSVKRNNKTFYYNSLNKFLGVCDEKECFDNENVSTGKIPPLPAIKNFVPYIDPNIANPKQEETKSEEE